jgi:hypothetical protein
VINVDASATTQGGSLPGLSSIARLRRSWHPHHQQQTRAMAGGKWPFGRKGNNDDEASGSRSRRSPPTPYQRASLACPCSATPHPAPAPLEPVRQAPARPAPARPRDTVYMPVRMARRLYVHNQPVPWPDVNLPGRWHLNCRRVPVPPVPREDQERSSSSAAAVPSCLLRFGGIPRSPSSLAHGTPSLARSGTRRAASATSATLTGTAPES